jgi:predicted dehydrogenase/threonine dehydrogenase-like Zn-dependent dehydrogenase
MKQIIQSARSGKLKVKNVPAPRADKGEILVQTHASLISAGTERMVVKFAKKNLISKAKDRPDLVKKVLNKARTEGIKTTINAVMARLDNPIPLGYSAAGTVISVGPELEGNFQVGQRVAIAGAGIANHSEINAVPANLAVQIPEGVSDDEAAFGTMGAIALHAVRNLDSKLGEVVAIFGAGIIGQIAAQLLSLSGVRVIVLDYDEARLNLAQKSGAEKCYNLAAASIKTNIVNLTGGIGCDGILIAAATDSNEPFVIAADIARDRARVCMVGMSGTEFPYAEFMKKEMSIIVSRSYGPGRYDQDYEGRGIKYPIGFIRWTETENLAEIMRLLSPSTKNKLNLSSLITHQFDINTADDAYKMILGETTPHLGVILHYPEVCDQTPTRIGPSKQTSNGCILGVIGAGNFARAVLLPELKKLSNVSLHTIAAKSGASANFAQNNFGFNTATTDATAIIDNKEINAVLIATRHDSHADLTVRALSAGKAVLVEKPLGLSEKEITSVREARKNSSSFFQVGFNRRFAPLTQKACDILKNVEGPRFMVFRINAGNIPTDNWLHNPLEGGGRIIGEMCHFIDLARHFARSKITSVQASAARNSNKTSDDITANLHFGDGSLATIAYTSLGDPGFPKERLEIFTGNTVLVLDNFKNLSVTANGSTKNHSNNKQDKGFKGELLAFTKAVSAGGPATIDENELFETSYGTLAVLESLQTGLTIKL